MKKLSKDWKIFIITTVVLIGSICGYYKTNNRNVFEEMYNSYYNFSLLGSVHRMGQIKPIRRDNRGADIVKLYYKEQVNGSNIKFSLTKFDDEKKIFLISSTLIAEGVYLDINYDYDMNSHKLKNDVSFRGKMLHEQMMRKNKQENSQKNTISQKNTYRKNQMNCQIQF